MAKTDNLIHYLSDVADAIREKEGSTDPINAQDFSDRIKELGNNQINMFDLVKNPKFICIVNDTSDSNVGFTDIFFGEGALFTSCTIHNKKKGMSNSIVFDIMNNGFKGFPCYVMFDYDLFNPFGGGGTIGAYVDEIIQTYPGDGYYITKDEFLKAWNEATLL